MAFFWGGSWVAAKKISPFMGPYSAAFLRFAIGSVSLVLFTIKKEGILPRLKKKQIIPVILLGVTGIFFYNIFFFQGLKYINAGRASLIVSIIPIFIVIISVLFLKE
jgi:drug/metabolite transporter (DMT)-like permease